MSERSLREVVLGVTTGVFGAMDYFNWSFLICFLGITALIVAGNVAENVRIVALGLSVLLVCVCGQLLFAVILALTRTPAPFKISSVPQGQPVRSGVYAIVEDVVAVDGGQGQSFRKQLEVRYLASQTVRELFSRLDLLWGTSGIATGVTTIGLVVRLKDQNVAFVLGELPRPLGAGAQLTFRPGWMVPWAYAVGMAAISTCVVQAALHKESSALRALHGLAATSAPNEGDH
ncbi:hypothetical protein LTR53_000141 [Teratosphaeriaceae sp. CCFEE 6253]|nr:hypothetical protein LTR53_000141 [Teratosphaeriaceae sp. CCFEE 6253]